MKLAALLHLYRVRLRSRLGAELLALSGIAVGVSLVFAALVANASLTGAVRELSDGIVGKADFQLAARSAAGFDQRLFDRVDGIPGASAAPLAEARVNLVGPAGRRSVLLVGGDPRFTSVGGELLRGLGPRRRSGRRGLFLPVPLARSLGLRVGGLLTVETGQGMARLRLAGELGEADVGGLAGSPVALAPLPLVQTVAGMRWRLSRIFVNAAPGRGRMVEARLRRLAGNRLNLGPADGEVAIFERAAYPTSASTALFSGLSALVGFLFALNAMLLTVPQRRRLIDDLRMSGYAPATLIRVVLLDAALLGTLGAGVGLLLGGLAARQLFGSPPGYLEAAFAVGSRQVVDWQSAALAAAAGLLAAFLSVLAPVRDSFSTIRIASPVAPADLPHRNLFLGGGILCLASGLAIVPLAPRLSLLGMGAALLALLLLLQVWLSLTTKTFGALCRRLRAPAAILAALELRAGSARVRTLALAATGAVAVFAAVAIGGARADLQRGLDGIAADLDQGAEVWIAMRGPTNIYGTAPIRVPAEQLREIEDLPGVGTVSRNRGSFLDVGRDRVWVLAPSPSRLGVLLRRQVKVGDAELAAWRLRKGGWVSLSQALASELGVEVGEEAELPLPAPTSLRVAALTDNFGWAGGAIVTSAATYRRAWGSAAISTLGLQLTPRARPAAVAAAARSVLGPSSPLRVETVSQRVRRQRATSRAGLSRLGQIDALVLLSSVLAMVASMAGLVWQRRPIFAALQVHGLGRDELWRALLLEAALLLGAGCSIGAGFGLIGQALLDRALETITGFPVSREMAISAAFEAFVLVTASAVILLAIPGWLAVRVRPEAGLRDE